MKKLIALSMLAIGLVGCGNQWEVTKKNFKSDFGDLHRHVVVYDSWSGKKVWEYTGAVYLEDSRYGKGNYTVVYYDSQKKARKNDFIGSHLAIIMRELTPEIEKELKDAKENSSGN